MSERCYTQGLWVGISRGPKTATLHSVSHPYTNGQALANWVKTPRVSGPASRQPMGGR